MDNGNLSGGEPAIGPTDLNGPIKHSSFVSRPETNKRSFFQDVFGSRRQADVKTNKFEAAAKKVEKEKAQKYFDSGMTKLNKVGPALAPALKRLPSVNSNEAIGKTMGKMFGVKSGTAAVGLDKFRQTYKALKENRFDNLNLDDRAKKELRTNSAKRRALMEGLESLDPRIKK
jgi:hypothetical protein